MCLLLLDLESIPYRKCSVASLSRSLSSGPCHVVFCKVHALLEVSSLFRFLEQSLHAVPLACHALSDCLTESECRRFLAAHFSNQVASWGHLPHYDFAWSSPLFLASGPIAVQFNFTAANMWDQGILELQFLESEVWWSAWSREDKHLVKFITLPAGSESLRFVMQLRSTIQISYVHLHEARPFLTLAAGNAQTCALLSSTGQVKCFGGSASWTYHMGSDLPPVDLGPSAEALQVSCRAGHRCVLLRGGGVKCWGQGNTGQLGSGSSSAIGDGLDLRLVDLGGADAVQVVVGDLHSCALLEGGNATCWGYNHYGQLGQGDQEDRGDEPGELGSALPTIDLGHDFRVVALAAGASHTCALSDEGEVKCFGAGEYGQLGQGNPNSIGIAPGQMGEALPAISLGAPAMQITAGSGHSCALLKGGPIKCWGRNNLGQLGQGHVDNVGDEPGELAQMPAISLGEGVRATRVVSGYTHTCAILQDESLQCWGSNGWGQLGQGMVSTGVGTVAGDMGNALQRAMVGPHRVREVAAGSGHTCVLLSDDTTRCFGWNDFGQLGTGFSTMVTQASQLGLALVAAELFTPTPRDKWGGLRLHPSNGGFTSPSCGSWCSWYPPQYDGYSVGWLEVWNGGSWGLICDDGWFRASAAAAARAGSWSQ